MTNWKSITVDSNYHLRETWTQYTEIRNDIVLQCRLLDSSNKWNLGGPDHRNPHYLASNGRKIDHEDNIVNIEPRYNVNK